MPACTPRRAWVFGSGATGSEEAQPIAVAAGGVFGSGATGCEEAQPIALAAGGFFGSGATGCEEAQPIALVAEQGPLAKTALDLLVLYRRSA